MSTRTYFVTCMLAALGAYACYVLISMSLNYWRFEYAVDDVYIHLAMAEQLYAGGYGVNAGELTSAASSPLYPILLPTWFGMHLQAWLPLIWNILSISVAGALLGWAIAQAELPRAGIWIAVAAPVALAMHVIAFTGMENMGHGAASLAIVIGLWRFVETRQIGALLVIGVFLAPALRLEGLAMALSAAGVVFVLGRYKAAVGLAVLALVPALMFVGTLTFLGLDPLPNSVNAKLPDPSSIGAGRLEGMALNFSSNLSTHGGRFVFGLMIVAWILAMVAIQKGERPRGLFALAIVISAAAHLAVASTGWMERYENYLVISLFATIAIMLRNLSPTTKVALLSLSLVFGLLTYAPNFRGYAYNPRAIALQQSEMSRFVKDYVQAPIAVNDLGYVSWNNPNYVLDLWGLASTEALEIRKSDPEPGWADPLADRYGVKVAMIYDHWLPDALGPDWVHLGHFVLQGGGGPFLGGYVVSFYARNAQEAQVFAPKIMEWREDLPTLAQFVAPGEELSQ